MVTILVAAVIALSVACLVLIRSRTIDPDQLVERLPGPLTMHVQIICGDCAGDGSLPNRTHLNRDGHCARCGGSSYLLASMVAANRTRARVARLGEALPRSSHPQVIPFQTPAPRSSRAAKIAV